MVQLSHPYMNPGKTIALARWTFVGKAMSLLFKMLPRLVIAPESLQMVTAAMKLKDPCSLEEKP